MASSAARPATCERFTLTERLLHWIHASAFFVLLGSGLVLYIPSFSEAIARRPLIKDIHFWTGISWAGAILLVALLGNRRALAETVREIDVFDRDDRRFLAGHTHAPAGALQRRPEGERRSLTAAFATLFFVSGLLLWYGERDTRFRLAGTVFLHDTLMYLSIVIVARPPLPVARPPDDAARASRHDARHGAGGLGPRPPLEVESYRARRRSRRSSPTSRVAARAASTGSRPSTRATA